MTNKIQILIEVVDDKLTVSADNVNVPMLYYILGRLQSQIVQGDGKIEVPPGNKILVPKAEIIQ